MKILDLYKELNHVLFESPYDGAWPKAMLMRYLEEGEDQFCRDTGFFVDPMNYSVTTEPDVIHYALDSRIIRVMNAYVDGRELLRFEQQDVSPARPAPLQLEDRHPRLFQTDHNLGNITVWPTPDAAFTVDLRVWRRSRVPLCEKTEYDCPEIPDHLQRALIEYAAYKALNHHDMELQDTVKAQDHYMSYMTYVERGRDAFWQLRGSGHRVGPNPLYVV
jgi:hypothetical protein